MEKGTNMKTQWLPFTRVLWVLTFVGVLAGCAGVKVEPPKGVTDTPGHHYAAGVKLLEAKEYGRAMEEFTRARELNPDYAPAYEGLGLAHLGQGNLKAAEEQMKLAKKKDRKYVPAYIGMGRVLTAKGELKDAVKEFEKALSLDAKSVQAHFYLGQAYLKDYEFGKAEASFSRALELDPAYTEARKEWERSVKIRMAAPGTLIGKKIALAEPITRGDLAELIATELGIEAKLRKRRPELFDASYQPPQGTGPLPAPPIPQITDVDGHWAKNAIELVARLNLMEPFPDRTFRPDFSVTRAALAVVLQDVLVVASGDQKLRTQFIGSPSPFPDLRSDHYAFNAVLLVTTRGLMEADRKSGAFRLAEPVSGPDALVSLRKLNELF